MRRLIIALACIAVAIAAVPQVAAAKGRVELRSFPPAGIGAGETWNADLFVHASAKEIAASDPPSILIHNDEAGWTEILARPVLGEPGAYTAAVRFPDRGTWTYHVHDPIAGGGYEFEPIVVAAPSELTGVPALWAILALAALSATAIVAGLRRRRFPQGGGAHEALTSPLGSRRA